MSVDSGQGRTHGLTDIYVNQDGDTVAPNGALVFPLPDGTGHRHEPTTPSIVLSRTNCDRAVPAAGATLVLLLDRLVPGKAGADLRPQAPDMRLRLSLDRLLEAGELLEYPVARIGLQGV